MLERPCYACQTKKYVPTSFEDACDGEGEESRELLSGLINATVARCHRFDVICVATIVYRVDVERRR